MTSIKIQTVPSDIPTPPYRDAERCMELRMNAKRGQRLYPDEQKFCEDMYRNYPVWYAAQADYIFEVTKPFGSR